MKDLATRLTKKNFQALGDPHDIALRDELAELCDQPGKADLAAMWRQAASALRTAEQAGRNAQISD